jgi:hypothetical protein
MEDSEGDGGATVVASRSEAVVGEVGMTAAATPLCWRHFRTDGLIVLNSRISCIHSSSVGRIGHCIRQRTHNQVGITFTWHH